MTDLDWAAVAGAALLVAADRPSTVLAWAARLSGLVVLAAAAGAGASPSPDRSLAVGLVVLVLLSFSAGVDGRWGRRGALPAAAGGLVAGAGLLLDDVELGAAIVGGGAAIVVAGSLARRVVDPVLLVAALLAAVRSAAQAPAAGDVEPVAVASLAGGAVVAAVLLVLRRRGSASTAPCAPLAVVAAGLVLVGQAPADLRGAGTLLAAGGVLALGAGHPAGLLAALPGLAAAVEAFGAADRPVHALAGVTIAGLAMATDRPDPASHRPSWALGPALAFAVVPVWGWAGAPTAEHRSAVVVAVAAGAMTLVAGVAVGRVPTAAGDGLGRLRRRSKPATHGSTHPLVEEGGPTEGAGETAEDTVDAGSEPGPSQHPVASSPRAVPVRAGVGGHGGRGRLRARPGRPPG